MRAACAHATRLLALKFGHQLDSSLNDAVAMFLAPPPAIAILGDRRWPQQAAKQERDKICKTKRVVHGNNVMSARLSEEVSIWSRNGAPSRKGFVVNGQMTMASKK